MVSDTEGQMTLVRVTLNDCAPELEKALAELRIAIPLDSPLQDQLAVAIKSAENAFADTFGQFDQDMATLEDSLDEIREDKLELQDQIDEQEDLQSRKNMAFKASLGEANQEVKSLKAELSRTERFDNVVKVSRHAATALLLRVAATTRAWQLRGLVRIWTRQALVQAQFGREQSLQSSNQDLCVSRAHLMEQLAAATRQLAENRLKSSALEAELMQEGEAAATGQGEAHRAKQENEEKVDELRSSCAALQEQVDEQRAENSRLANDKLQLSDRLTEARTEANRELAQAQSALRTQLSTDEQRFDNSMTDLKEKLAAAVASSSAAANQVLQLQNKSEALTLSEQMSARMLRRVKGCMRELQSSAILTASCAAKEILEAHEQLTAEESAHNAAIAELQAAHEQLEESQMELHTCAVRAETLTITATQLKSQLTVALDSLFLGGARIVVRVDAVLQGHFMRCLVRNWSRNAAQAQCSLHLKQSAEVQNAAELATKEHKALLSQSVVDHQEAQRDLSESCSSLMERIVKMTEEMAKERDVSEEANRLLTQCQSELDELKRQLQGTRRELIATDEAKLLIDRQLGLANTKIEHVDAAVSMLEVDKAAVVAELDLLGAKHRRMREEHSIQLVHAQECQQELEDCVVDAVESCTFLVTRLTKKHAGDLNLYAEIHRLQLELLQMRHQLLNEESARLALERKLDLRQPQVPKVNLLPVAASPPKFSTRVASLHAVFGQFDLDDSGFIERHELQQLGEVRRQLGQRSGTWTSGKNDRMIAKMDGNEDGQVAREQFVLYFDAALERNETEFNKIVAQFMAVAKACRRTNRSTVNAVSPRKLNLSPQKAFSPRVTTPRGSTLKRFRVRTGASGAERVYNGHLGGVLCLLLSEDSRLLFTASQDGTARAYSTDGSLEASIIFEGHTAAVSCLALHGKYLITGSHDGTVRQWKIESDNQSQQPIRSSYTYYTYNLEDPPKAPCKPISAISFIGNHLHCFCRNPENPVVSFETQVEQDGTMEMLPFDCGLRVIGGGDTVTCVDGQHGSLFAGTMGGSLLQIRHDPASDTLQEATIGQHGAEVTSVAADLSHRSSGVVHIYSGSRDATIKKWCLSSQSLLRTFTGHLSVIRGLHLPATNAGEAIKLMSGSADNTVRTWDSKTGACQASLTVRESSVTAIITCHNKMYVAGADGNVRVFVV